MNKVLTRVFWRWFLFGQSGWNYEKCRVLAICTASTRSLRRNTPDLKSRRMQLKYTASSLTPTTPWRLDPRGKYRPEEQTGLAGKDAVAGIKTGLMGPLAGIGDTLFFVIPTTIIGSVASYLALQGNPVGLILWLLFALVRMLFMRFSISKGYQEGVNLLGSLTNSLNKITRAANILGLTVIGALIPSVVKANLNFEFSYGEVSLKLQSIADQIMPGLIPLLVVGFTYWLLGLKKMNSTRVIFVLITLGIVGYNLNILG